MIRILELIFEKTKRRTFRKIDWSRSWGFLVSLKKSSIWVNSVLCSNELLWFVGVVFDIESLWNFFIEGFKKSPFAWSFRKGWECEVSWENGRNRRKGKCERKGRTERETGIPGSTNRGYRSKIEPLSFFYSFFPKFSTRLTENEMMPIHCNFDTSRVNISKIRPLSILVRIQHLIIRTYRRKSLTFIFKVIIKDFTIHWIEETHITS